MYETRRRDHTKYNKKTDSLRVEHDAQNIQQSLYRDYMTVVLPIAQTVLSIIQRKTDLPGPESFSLLTLYLFFLVFHSNWSVVVWCSFVGTYDLGTAAL